MARHLLLIFLACLGAAGCSRNGSGPEAFSVSQWTGAPFDQYFVSWYPPASGDLTGYQLEWRAGTGAFETITSFDAAATARSIDLGLGSPDDLEIEFRLRALPDPAGTRTASVFLRRGLRPPALACGTGSTRCDAGPGGFELKIENRSPGATQLVLSRSKVPAGGGPSIPGPTFPLDPATTTFVDPLAGDWSEEATYTYALTAVKGGKTSQGVEVLTNPLPLLAPTSLALVGEAGGIRISFQAQSSRALCYSIERMISPAYFATIQPCLAPLAPGVTPTFLDTGASTSSIYLYRVTARGALAASFPAQAGWLPAPPSGFSSRFVTVSPGTTAIRLPSGAFATAVAYARVTLHAPGPAGTVSLSIPVAWSRSPPAPVPMALAGDGTIHAFVGEWRTGETGIGLDHATFDGQHWLQEELGRGQIDDPIVMAMGLDGMLRAAWATGADLSVAALTGAGWRVATFPAVVAPYSGLSLSVAGDAQGVTHLVYRDLAGALVHTFDAPDGWHLEPLPSGSGSDSLYLYPGPGTLRLAGTNPLGGVNLVERSSIGWGAPTFFADATVVGSSADGSALAIAGPTSLRIRDQLGTRVTARVNSGIPTVATGIDGRGKAWVLEIVPAAPAATETTALLYEEL